MRKTDIPEIQSLTTPEKILLVGELWERICVDESSVAVPQSPKEQKAPQKEARGFLRFPFVADRVTACSPVRSNPPAVNRMRRIRSALDTHGRIAYTPTHQKQVLLT